MKKLNSGGKVLTIFLVIIAILLITLTALSMFFYNVEIDRRKEAEKSISTIENEYEKVKKELKEVKKQNFLLVEKNKEADNRVNSLMDEVDLEKGLREELKKEALTLKEEIENIRKAKESVVNKTASQVGDLEQKIAELEAKLKVELNRNKELIQQNEELSTMQEKLKKMSAQKSVTQGTPQKQAPPPGEKKEPEAKKATPQTQKTASNKTPQKPKSKTAFKMDVELEQIVVTPDVRMSEDDILGQITRETNVDNSVETEDIPDGRILSVDIETEFVVINLGEKNGVQKGLFMSVYRGNEYLGDIKVTRTQDEMAAADLVPPLASKMIRKNDQVIAK